MATQILAQLKKVKMVRVINHLVYLSPSALFLDSSAGGGVSPTHYASAFKKAADSKRVI